MLITFNTGVRSKSIVIRIGKVLNNLFIKKQSLVKDKMLNTQRIANAFGLFYLCRYIITIVQNKRSAADIIPASSDTGINAPLKPPT